MTTWLRAVTIALQIGPFLGLIIMVPYVILHYKRSRYISVTRCTYIYLFLLYLMAAVFMPLLPFPSFETVAKLTWSPLQLVPFEGIADFFRQLGDPAKGGITGTVLWGMLFNIALLLPLGFFLRFLFRFSWKKTVLTAFLTSLFFEVTQLTGIFFIYPRAYRIFDVDDLMFNTLGALLGWLIVPLLAKYLPSPEAEKSHRLVLGAEVSLDRRFWAALIDLFPIVPAVYLTIGLVPPFSAVFRTDDTLNKALLIFLLYVVFTLLYRGVGLWLGKGKTPGMLLTNLQLLSGDRAPSLGACLLRTLVSGGLLTPLPVIVLLLLLAADRTGRLSRAVLVAVAAASTVLFARVILAWLLNGITHENILPEDQISGTRLYFRHPTKLTGTYRLVSRGTLLRREVDPVSEKLYETMLSAGFSSKTAAKARLLTEGAMLDHLDRGLSGREFQLYLNLRALQNTLVLIIDGQAPQTDSPSEDYYHVLAGLRLAFESHVDHDRTVVAIDL